MRSLGTSFRQGHEWANSFQSCRNVKTRRELAKGVLLTNGGDGNGTFHTVSTDTGTLYVVGGDGTDKLILEDGYAVVIELFGTTYLKHSSSNHNIQYSSIEGVVDTDGDPYVFG